MEADDRSYSFVCVFLKSLDRFLPVKLIGLSIYLKP